MERDDLTRSPAFATHVLNKKIISIGINLSKSPEEGAFFNAKGKYKKLLAFS